MPLNVTVTANEAFADGTSVDRAALRRASKPTVSITGQISTADIAAAAAITYAQLADVTEGYVLRGNGSNKAAAIALGTGASLTSGGVLTPSTGTITGDHLVTNNSNVINSLSTTLASAEGADFVMINDSTDNSLQKVTVTNLLNAGVDTSSQSITDLANLTSGSGTATVDMDANPVQYVEIASGTAVTFANPTNMPASGPPSATAKSVTLIIWNNSGGAVSYTFGGNWKFLKSAPTQIADGKTAVVAITAYSSSLLIAGYAAED
ncbi:MAG: hypothetical protein CL877_01030 [Dehalococcoidales bacterium]|jgi:hypothetical protein|nr:hypothetical protein [Dehalococcoidales bacterium]|tara:strand:+ start:1271 stop:2065 length:795 start_codon:yes stop_codon:yes gene_type:complete